ncbi:MAG: cytochrome c biogenesis protein CcdA [Actinobacteria bacterium]|nr:cytochrome c biogenesis protein CcdA [Actinomycetota bacterium]
MNGSLAYAFGVGMVATFNPCGFAMLPAYLSYFLGLEGEQDDAPDASILRALAVGASMTAGFLVVFGVLGLVLEPALTTINRRLPWVTILLGVVLIIIGVAMLAGRTISVRLPSFGRGPESRELSSVFLFGISYALVSLSCTLSLFTAAISTTVQDENVIAGILAFLAYGLGMGLVLMVITLAIALARQSLVRNLRRVLPYINRVSGALLVLAGLYVTYYGWYELRVFDGDISGGGVAQWTFDLTSSISRWINEVGATRLGLILGLIIAIAVLVALATRGRAEDR